MAKKKERKSLTEQQLKSWRDRSQKSALRNNQARQFRNVNKSYVDSINRLKSKPQKEAKEFEAPKETKKEDKK